MESGKSKSFCAVRAPKFAGPADPNPEPKPGLNPYRKNPSVATLCGKNPPTPADGKGERVREDPRPKGRGQKLQVVGQGEMCIERICGTTF